MTDDQTLTDLTTELEQLGERIELTALAIEHHQGDGDRERLAWLSADLDAMRSQLEAFSEVAVQKLYEHNDQITALNSIEMTRGQRRAGVPRRRRSLARPGRRPCKAGGKRQHNRRAK